MASQLLYTVQNFDEFPVIRQYFPDRDDDKMNTLAFINFLLVKLFPTLIRQKFVPYGNHINEGKSMP